MHSRLFGWQQWLQKVKWISGIGNLQGYIASTLSSEFSSFFTGSPAVHVPGLVIGVAKLHCQHTTLWSYYFLPSSRISASLFFFFIRAMVKRYINDHIFSIGPVRLLPLPPLHFRQYIFLYRKWSNVHKFYSPKNIWAATALPPSDGHD